MTIVPSSCRTTRPDSSASLRRACATPKKNAPQAASLHVGELKSAPSVVRVDLVRGTSAQDFGATPLRDRLERVAPEECLERLLRLPLAQDDVAPERLHV